MTEAAYTGQQVTGLLSELRSLKAALNNRDIDIKVLTAERDALKADLAAEKALTDRRECPTSEVRP